MSSQVEDVLRLCCEVSAQKKIKAAVKNCLKGAAVVSGVAFAGGLVGGPAGLFVGGALGGALGGWLTSGQFKPLPEILMELPSTQRDKLYSDVMAVLGTMEWSHFSALFDQVNGNASLYQQVLAAIVAYTKKELNAEVQYGD
ncbi:protein C19orf12 homolog [Xyrauchen texanus]|uniref:protein C19orf12 homolog n=1 Tax=Xyrauchen texanus TaxID=154827 RepID=UPI00224215C0|nr:protein C19orf12 homolog [Xyrauchen texanus]